MYEFLFSASIFMPPLAGFGLGVQSAWKWKWVWVGAVAGALVEAFQIHTEGTLGTLATGQDWSNFWTLVAVYVVGSFYACFALGVAVRALGNRVDRSRPVAESTKDPSD